MSIAHIAYDLSAGFFVSSLFMAGLSKKYRPTGLMVAALSFFVVFLTSVPPA
jgi:hypothetical protein